MAQKIRHPGTKKLSDTFVKSRKPAPKGERHYWRSDDHKRVWFCVTSEILPDGQAYKSFLYGTTRFPGSELPTDRLLGTYPTMSIADAHKKARKWDTLMDEGIDPADEENPVENEKVAATIAATNNSFGKRVPEFITFCVKDGKRQWKETQRILLKEFAQWAHRPIETITADEAVDLEEIAQGLRA